MKKYLQNILRGYHTYKTEMSSIYIDLCIDFNFKISEYDLQYNKKISYREDHIFRHKANDHYSYRSNIICCQGRADVTIASRHKTISVGHNYTNQTTLSATCH